MQLYPGLEDFGDSSGLHTKLLFKLRLRNVGTKAATPTGIQLERWNGTHWEHFSKRMLSNDPEIPEYELASESDLHRYRDRIEGPGTVEGYGQFIAAGKFYEQFSQLNSKHVLRFTVSDELERSHVSIDTVTVIKSRSAQGTEQFLREDLRELAKRR